MTSARYCPLHKQVLEDLWEGARCPEGHWYGVVEKHGGSRPDVAQQVYWIVDIELAFEHPQFHLGTVIDGHAEWEPWFAAAWEPEESRATDYREHPETWAKHRGRKKRDMSLLDRANYARI